MSRATGLEGIRVVEMGEGVSAAYAAKLMADLGADVVKIEPPGGDRARLRGPFPGGVPDPEQSGLFLYLNTNKRGVRLDPARERPELESLVARADILVHNLPAAQMDRSGIVYDALRRLNPRLVLCSITPFGLTGPYRDYRAYDINLVHGGGWGYLSPGALELAAAPPLTPAGSQAGFQGGLAGALAALAACRAAQRTGRGEHIDLSVQSFVASFLEQALPYYTYVGQVATRFGQRLLYPWGIYRCADGPIFLAAIEEDQWQRLVELMGNPEWAQLEIFGNTVGRSQNWDIVKLHLEEWFADWKVEDLFHAGQARRICFAPVFSLSQVAAQDHLRSRGFFVEVTHPRAGRIVHPGAPYRLERPWWSLRRPAPLLGEHTAEVRTELETPVPPRPAPAVSPTVGLPLEGVRVVDLTWVWAGPFAAMHLAHLGADVIKLESMTRLDAGRRLPVVPRGEKWGPNRSGYFNQWNQGKRSCALNFGKPEGVRIAKELIARSDVVIENFSTGVLDRLGLGYEVLRELRPDIILASISGYGHTGPLKNYMAYGPAVAPLTGLSSLTGYAGDVPREVGISYGDPNAGINAAVAIAAALLARERTGEGQHIDLSLWEPMAALVAEGWMEYAMNGSEPERMGNRHPQMAPHGCFRCAGDECWVTLACESEEEWRALCAAIGQPALASDPRFADPAARKRNEDELERTIEAWTSQRDRWDVTRELQAAGVAAFPSLSSRDLVEDPHLAQRGFFERLAHPEVGVRTHAGIPWRLAEAPNGVRAAAPLLGADTEAVLGDLLGYSPAQVAKLREDGVSY